MRHLLSITIFAVVMTIGVGCQTGHQLYMERLPPVSVLDKPPALQPGYEALNNEGARNYVINQMEIGIDAFQLGHDDLARQALDGALDAIETVYGNDVNAKQARKAWNEEGRKTFKGEPYERVMAYYYRGLLYIKADDLENARACFRRAIYQDSFVEEEQNRADVASMIYLEAWCSQMLGDNSGAEDALRFYTKLKPDTPPPSPNDNLLIIAETGVAPRKIAAGEHGSKLAYSRGDAGSPAVSISIDAAKQQTLYPLEDVYFQASTRGGRPVDHLLAGKVVFKGNMKATGDTLTQVGTTGLLIGSQMRDRSDRDTALIASGVITLLGIGANMLSANVKPRADTRRIRNLPNMLHIIAVPANPGTHFIHVQFKDGAKDIRMIETAIPAPPNTPTLVWARESQRIVSGRNIQDK